MLNKIIAYLTKKSVYHTCDTNVQKLQYSLMNGLQNFSLIFLKTPRARQRHSRMNTYYERLVTDYFWHEIEDIAVEDMCF